MECPFRARGDWECKPGADAPSSLCPMLKNEAPLAFHDEWQTEGITQMEFVHPPCKIGGDWTPCDAVSRLLPMDAFCDLS